VGKIDLYPESGHKTVHFLGYRRLSSNWTENRVKRTLAAHGDAIRGTAVTVSFCSDSAPDLLQRLSARLCAVHRPERNAGRASAGLYTCSLHNWATFVSFCPVAAMARRTFAAVILKGAPPFPPRHPRMAGRPSFALKSGRAQIPPAPRRYRTPACQPVWWCRWTPVSTLKPMLHVLRS